MECVRRLALLAVALAAAGCGSSARSLTRAGTPNPVPLQPVASPPPSSSAPAATVAVLPTCTPGRRSVADDRTALVIAILAPTVVRASPRDAARAVLRLAPRNVYGLRQIVLGLEEQVDAACVARWYRVKLPAKPNGRTGWIAARSLEVETVRTRVVADLSARRIVVYRDGKLAQLWYGLYNPNGTNNTAELNALHHALKIAEAAIAAGETAEIRCDSTYAINCISKWATGWEKKGWRKTGGEIKNLQIIQAAYALYSSIEPPVKLTHVSAHVGTEGNELADRMAMYAVESRNSDLREYGGELDIKAILRMRRG